MIVIDSLHIPDRLDIPKLTFAGGELTFLLGENGAGKSTLLTALVGLNATFAGSISINGESIHSLNLNQLASFRAWLSQDTGSHFDLTVSELLSFFTRNARVPSWLDALEITPFYGRRLASLSGGERQRIQIARVLLQVAPSIQAGKALIALDEPLTALDLRFQIAVLGLLQDLRKLGNCVVLSSHHPHYVHQYADQVIVLKAGKVISQGTPATALSEKVLQACYGIDVAADAPYLLGRGETPC